MHVYNLIVLHSVDRGQESSSNPDRIHVQIQPRPQQHAHPQLSEDLSASEREENSGRQPQKRKYALGGRKKLRSVTTILEAHLEEMLGINENERHEFYAKMVSMPAVKLMCLWKCALFI